MKRLLVIAGWVALYVASVVFSFGAMNATARNGFVSHEKYSKGRFAGGMIAMIPALNLLAGIPSFLADGWTWDRSDPNCFDADPAILTEAGSVIHVCRGGGH